MDISKIRITKVKVYLLEKKLSSTMSISRGGFKVRNHAIVEVHTNEGVTGLGEAIGSAKLCKAIIDSHLSQLAIGLNPCRIEEVRGKLLDSQVYFEKMGSTICGASAIETACWDIKAKLLGVPLYELLGGLYQKELELYASNIYWEEKPKDMVKVAEKILKQGIKSVKAHIGREGPQSDAVRVKELRNAIGTETRLMIDLNAGYTYSQALKAADLWNKHDIYWLEEPLNSYHLERLPELKQHTNIPIALGENEFRTYGFKRAFDLKAVDFAMPDIGRVGGVLETKNVCNLAESYGVEISPHNYSSGVLLAATFHVMAATPNCKLLEFDASENSIYHEFFEEPLKIKNGKLQVPDAPGLGVSLKPSILKKYAV